MTDPKPLAAPLSQPKNKVTCTNCGSEPGQWCGRGVGRGQVTAAQTACFEPIAEVAAPLPEPRKKNTLRDLIELINPQMHELVPVISGVRCEGKPVAPLPEMASEPKLLPCPFCGGHDAKIRRLLSEDAPHREYARAVWCRDCHAVGRSSYPIGWTESDKAAEEAWNDRHAPAPVPLGEPAQTFERETSDTKDADFFCPVCGGDLEDGLCLTCPTPLEWVCPLCGPECKGGSHRNAMIEDGVPGSALATKSAPIGEGELPEDAWSRALAVCYEQTGERIWEPYAPPK